MSRPAHEASAEPTADAGARSAARGFTLMEVLAAVFLTSVVIAAAFGFYINLSDASIRAAQTIREGLHATGVLDRIARDLEGAVLLVKPDDLDPLSHPWVFVAASEYAFDGADRVKFITRSQKPRALDYHTSDMALVAYFLEPAEDGTATLYRWLAPGLPLEYDPTFPPSDDPRSLILAERLSRFSLRFQQEDGEWVSEWDSSQLVQSSMLPRAVEIEIAFASEGQPQEEVFSDEEDDARAFSLHVMLPLLPIDLQGMILAKQERDALAAAAGALSGGKTDPDDDQASDDQCADASCSVTVGQCLAKNPAGRSFIPPTIKDCQCADEFLPQLEEKGISCF